MARFELIVFCLTCEIQGTKYFCPKSAWYRAGPFKVLCFSIDCGIGLLPPHIWFLHQIWEGLCSPPGLSPLSSSFLSFPFPPFLLSWHAIKWGRSQKLPNAKPRSELEPGSFTAAGTFFPALSASAFILLLSCREHGFCSAYFPTSYPALFSANGLRVSQESVTFLQALELHLSQGAAFIPVPCCRQPALLSLAASSTTSFSLGFWAAVIFCTGGGTALCTSPALLIQESLPVWSWSLVLHRVPCLCVIPEPLFSEELDIRHCWRQDAQWGWSNPLHFCLWNQDLLWLMVLGARWLAGLLNLFLGVSVHKSNKMVLPSYSWHMCLMIWSFAF